MEYNKLEMLEYEVREFFGVLFGNIEMTIKRLIKHKFYKNLSEKDIPENTFYCYGGCRACPLSYNCCPYFDRSVLYALITGSDYNAYCHYCKFGFDDLLSDQCKICGISEYYEEE